MNKRPQKNAKDAHLNIDRRSPTWIEVERYLRHVLATSWGILEDPGAGMVDIRQAQGDVRTAKGLLKLAYPAEKTVESGVPEDYPTGGPD